MRSPQGFDNQIGGSRGAQVISQPPYGKPGIISWLALLFAGVSALASLNIESIVIWSLSNGLIHEAATRNLPEILKYVFLAGVIFGGLSANRIAIYNVLSVYHLEPVQAELKLFKREFRPVLVWFATVGRGLFQALIQPLLSGVSAIAHATHLVLRSLLRVILAAVNIAWRVVVSGFDRVNLVVSAIAGVIGSVVSYLWRGLAAGAGFVWLGIATVFGSLVLVVISIASVIGSGLTLIWSGLAAGASFVWLGVSTIFGYLSRVVANIARAFGSGLNYLWRRFNKAAGNLWLGVVAIVRYVERVLSAIGRANNLVFSYIWQCVAVAARFAWRGIVIVAVYLTSVVYTVSSAIDSGVKYIWRGIVAAVDYVGNGISTAASHVKLALLSIGQVIGAGVSYIRRGLTVVLVASVGVVVLGFALLVATTIVRAIGLSIAKLWVVFVAAAGQVGDGIATTLGALRQGISKLLRYLFVGIFFPIFLLAGILWFLLGSTWRVMSTAGRTVGSALRYIWHGFQAVGRYLRQLISNVTGIVGREISAGFGYLNRLASTTSCAIGSGLNQLGRGFAAAAAYVQQLILTALRPVRLLVYAIAEVISFGASSIGRGLAAGTGFASSGLSAVLNSVVLGLAFLAKAIGFFVLIPIIFVAKIIVQAINSVMSNLFQGGALAAVYLGRGISVVLGVLWQEFSKTFRDIWAVLAQIYGLLAQAGRQAAVIPGRILGYLSWLALLPLKGLWKTLAFVMWVLMGSFTAVFDVGKLIGWMVQNRRIGIPDSGINPMRWRLLSLAGTVASVIVGAFLVIQIVVPTPEASVTVVHWTTGHLTRDGLLNEMAIQFNSAGHRTESGSKIVVEVYDAPSELQGKYLSELLRFGTRRNLNKETNGYVVENIPDPVIVTPSSAHWLVTTNFEVGRMVVDLKNAKSIVRPVIGIVTYEEMARCLGWPEKQIGFADIIALREDPLGWDKYPCAKAEWGQKPLLAFTDPTTSSTGRSLHLSLYSIAANTAPQDLTIDDVNNPEVVAYVKNFQNLIDHYLIGTTVLNTKIYQGPRYGHFFIMPEDNLIHLYEGTEKSYLNGIKTTAPPITERMVMIYPKEGSMPRNNCACIVSAEWVSEAQVEASNRWIDFIREDEQQRAFMAAGFRPGTDLPLDFEGSKISSKFGLDPDEPKVVLNPSLTQPEVAAAIDANWVQVKRPGIVTFVIDTSGSMLGGKLRQTKDGMVRALQAMAATNQVGFLSFDDKVYDPIPVAPLAENHTAIENAVLQLQAGGETALYDAIKKGIEMTDAVPGEADAIRAVVVLTDGAANRGTVKLNDLIHMMSTNEREIQSCEDIGCSRAVELGGIIVEKADLIGIGPAIATRHPIQVFLIGIGNDADLEVGRMLAEATGAEFQGVTEADLANLLEEFSKFF